MFSSAKPVTLVDVLGNILVDNELSCGTNDHVAQGGLIAGGFCMPSGLGIVGVAAIERTLCCSGGQYLFQVFWDQEVHFFLGKLGSPLPLWHSLHYIYIHIIIYIYMGSVRFLGPKGIMIRVGYHHFLSKWKTH